MQLKAAVFLNQYGSISLIHADGRGICWADDDKNYTRVTEYVDIDFPDIEAQAKTELELEHLNKLETEANQRFESAMRDIRIKRAALTGGEPC